eukprot:gnl/TRDRNA2_/TRDRNA2_80422_c0_seq1.p1 gnl/TRDRNA2_/TRDRNA2_80422_c0~~gnl/TRDRNA2_/TRDRNA2_80422_c0_seq1.p1  ORF type:complete len:389 (+),score=67.57 gnl/TRDRNA2_/TRDRNA2_80422_c0_seq1:139-1167(+)
MAAKSASHNPEEATASFNDGTLAAAGARVAAARAVAAVEVSEPVEAATAESAVECSARADECEHNRRSGGCVLEFDKHLNPVQRLKSPRNCGSQLAASPTRKLVLGRSQSPVSRVAVSGRQRDRKPSPALPSVGRSQSVREACGSPDVIPTESASKKQGRSSLSEQPRKPSPEPSAASASGGGVAAGPRVRTRRPSPVGLRRFTERQKMLFPRALREIQDGKKQSCWMWFVIPTPPFIVNGVEQGSATNRKYALRSDDEAREYLAFQADGVNLRSNYLTIMIALQEQLAAGKKAVHIIGCLDEPKLRSSVRYFERITRDTSDTELHDVVREVLRLLKEEPVE